MPRRGYDVIVVGGGVIGCGVAYELACRGVDVAVVERGAIGREASWASAGVVSLPNRMEMAPERIEITRRGLARYPELVAELEAETGLAIDYRRPGEFLIAIDEAAAEWLNALGQWQQGLGFKTGPLDVETARVQEPALPPELAAVWFAPDVGSLSLHRFTQALALAAEKRGATIRPHTPVRGVTHEGGRVTGVALLDGKIAADLVVLAAGAWTTFFGDSVRVPLPTKPIKGQMLAIAGPPLRPRHTIGGHGGYVVPRVDGTVLVAATEEDVGFDRRVTGEGIAFLLALARTLSPSLLMGEVSASWSGLRPGTIDREPIMGPVDGYDALWIAAGHFRTGAKEAPGSAELIASSIVARRVDPLLIPFSPNRSTLTMMATV